MLRSLVCIFAITSVFSLFAGCSGDVECPEGASNCSDVCVDLSSNDSNCGACGTVCAAGESCNAGACTSVSTCPSGQDECSGACVDTDTDRAHCGGCGTACAPGEVCSAGSCQISCPDKQQACDGGCFDTDNAPQHCGDCNSACASGEVCVSGGCEVTCPADQTQCGQLCVSTDTDENFCGDCNTACAAGELCVAGSCQVSCGGTSVECAGNCVDTDISRDHCGGCDIACAADELCVAGNCEVVCGPTQGVCMGTCTSTLTDETNCGGCGTTCGANELCQSGGCTLTCAGSTPDECNGACTNVLNDPANCNGCGIACGQGEVCSNGSCQGNCGPGLADCMGTCTSTLTDPGNCGGCGTMCAGPTGATGVCVAGNCASLCNDGLADCNGDLRTMGGDGCEIDLGNDANNCNACGTTCTFANATGICMTGACQIGQCAAGFENCNVNEADGCEAELAADPFNCNGCGIRCGVGQICANGTCINGAETGEDCTGPIVLNAGTTTAAWAATTNDYLTTDPTCQTVGSVEGPDVVFRYTPTFNGFVQLDVTKATNQRHTMVVSDGTCGTLTPELACVSDFSATSLSTTFTVTANTDYFVYVIDTTSGGQPLPNPLVLDLTETNCANTPPAAVVTLQPTVGSTTATLLPVMEVTFDQAVRTDLGVVTVTGNLGTSLSYDLSGNPTQINFTAGDTTMTIDPGIQFPAGEQVTVSWTGMVDGLCGLQVPAPVPAWTFNIIVPPCVPGAGGMVGSNITRVPSGLGSFTEYYVAADTNPTGWVYAGGTSDLRRLSKDGVTAEDVEVLAGLATANLGYAMLVDGQNIYTMDSATGTTGRLFRISTDGGMTWAIQDMATFATAPADDFRSVAASGGRIYMITHEATSTVNTEIWSIDPAAATLPDTAVLEGGFSGYTSCAGLAVDANYYYTACGGGSEPVLRIDRTTLAVTELTTDYDLSSTVNAVHGSDINADGVFDFIYVQGWYEEGYFVCDPGTTPFTGLHFQFNTGANSNYGMGYDPAAGALWMIDDGNRDFIRVQ